ncbi:MAG: response regulator [Chloroflexota bacterium]
MKILIAEDESIIRLGLKSMLEGMGHTVWTAVNGREALNMVRNDPFDLAILDIKMPYTDGIQAAKTICKSFPLPILMLTAHSDDDLIEKATDLPIQGYLIKPVKREELHAAITIAHKRFSDMSQLVEENIKLNKTLEQRKLIDQAKGKLMKSGLDEEAAYKWLQKHARDNRQSIYKSAQIVLKWAG